MSPLDYAKKIAYSSEKVVEQTYELAKYASRIDGDLVECGVAAGAQVIAMLHACKDKTVWAFDSFQGIPLPSSKDDQMPGIRKLTTAEQKALPKPGLQALESTGITSYSVEQFEENISKAFRLFGGTPTNYKIVKGWFEHTMPDNRVDSIAMLRLDGDLYNSTYVCLDNLFHKVVTSGVVIIDDYALKGCREACNNYFKKISYKPDYKTIEGNGYTVAYFHK